MLVEIAAGHTETISATISLTVTGTALSPIVFTKVGAGANPLLTAYAGGAATPTSAIQDGIWRLVGSDYVTIDGIDLTDPNVTNPATMEYGYALYKASATDGCQFNTIKNCVITLNRINNANSTNPMVEGSVGIIAMNATSNAANAILTATTTAGSNSNNKFYSNTIQNCNYGIAIIGFAASTPFTASDFNNDIGGSSAATGNTIINYGGGAVTYASAAIRTLAQQNLNASFNVINNNNGSGVNHAATLRGIYVNTATSASSSINSNTITINGGGTAGLISAIENNSGSTAASNTVAINNNLITNCTYTTATTGVLNAIVNSGTPALLNINGNTINNLSLNSTGTHNLIETGSPTSATVNGNTITAVTNTGASGTLYILKTTSPQTLTVNNNLIDGISYTNVTSTGSIYGFYAFSSPVNVTINNNIIKNLSVPTTGTINGIRENSSSGNKIVQGNQIYNFSTTSGGAGGATFAGIYLSTGTIDISNNTVYNLNSTGGTGGTLNGIQVSSSPSSNIFKNKIYDLSSTSTGVVVSGILVSGGTTNNIFNNVIGSLSTPSVSASNALVGINITGGTTANIYYNTVRLDGVSSGANFGSSALSTASFAVNIRNNIFINNSTPNGTGISAAFRRSTTALTNYSVTSNNNIYYAGVPSATTAIYFDGATVRQTMADFKTVVTTAREANSGTENPTFASLVGSNANFLNFNPSALTIAESGATNIAGITNDYNNLTRQGNAGYAGTGSSPDMGAYEFEGTAGSIVVNSVSITPTGNQCVAVLRNVTASVTPGTAPITSITLNYAYNGVLQTPIVMTGGSFTASSVWSATIPVATPASALVTWTVNVSDGSIPRNTVGTSYADEPLTGASPSIAFTSTILCSGSPTTLNAVNIGNVQVGTGALTTASSGVSNGLSISPFSHYYGGYRFQYLIRASELTALGLSAGNLTSLGIDVTSVGGTYNGLAVSVTQTTVNALGAGFVSAGLSQVFTGNYTPFVGVNTFNFATPYAWDGTSNVVVQICWGNNNGGGIASEVAYDNTAYVSSFCSRVDNQVGSAVCGSSAATIQNSARPKLILSGNKTQGYTYSWTNGTDVIAATSSVVISPTVNTSYSYTLSDVNNCSVTSNTIAITVKALPSTPSFTNSIQCGIAVSSASVAGSTSYNWYSAPTSTTVLQSGAAENYTTAINTNTTWYVAGFENGCESATRAVVTTSVSVPDPLIVNSSASNLCIGGANTITLTAAPSNTATNYTSYIWEPSTTVGSGMTSTVTGNTQNITPTQVGNYTYSVTATDGICTAINTITVSLSNIPSITASANPSVACSGADVNLTALTTGIGSGTVSVGNGTTTSTTYPNPFYSLWSNTHNQYLITAAELNAANVYAGNISSLAIEITAGTMTMQDFTLKMGHSAATNMSAFVNNSGFTNVFSAASLTPVIGLNTLSFNAPFNWDGVSNIVIEVCHGNSGSSTTMSSTAKVDNTAFVSTIHAHKSAAAAGNLACAELTTNLTTYSVRPKFIFTSQTISNVSAGFDWTWNPGSVNTSTATVNPVNNGSVIATEIYTATVTNTLTGCSNTTTVGVAVNPSIAMPIATNATQCGIAVPTASVSGGSNYKWYSAPTSTTVLQLGSSSNFTTSISSTTTWYVSSFDGSCESPRVALTQTVASPPALSVSSPTAFVCANIIHTLSVTSANANYDSYTWLPATHLYTDAAATVPYTSGSASVLYYKSPTTTVTNYTLSASDVASTCASNLVFSVQTDLPTITASLSPSVVCSGADVNLTALTSGIASGTVNIGNGSVIGSNYDAIFYHLFGGNKTQHLIRASELIAAGLSAGNITQLKIDIATGGGSYSDFAISVASTTNTTMAAIDNTASFTSVYSNSPYVTTTGINNYNFATPFNWDGVSNVIVQFCWSNNNGGGTNNYAKIDPTSYVSTAYYRADNQTSSLICGGTTATGTTSNRPRFIFTGQTISNISSGFDWTWNPGSVNTSTATVNPVNNGSVIATEIYTATVTNTVTGCSNTATVSVNVNPSIAMPIATNATQCGVGLPTASVTGSTNYKWYSAPTSTTVLQSGSSSNFTTSINSTTTWYVSSFNGACEGPRVALTQTVTSPPALSVTTLTNATCANVIQTLSVTSTLADYTSYVWTPNTNLYSNASATTPYAGGNLSSLYYSSAINGVINYSVIATNSLTGCSNIITTSIETEVPSITASATPSLACVGNTVNLLAQSLSSASGTYAVGSGSITSSIYPNPFYSLWSNTHNQYLITAAELNASGIVAGNINSLAIEITSGTMIMQDFTLKMGHSAATNMLAYENNSGFTNVFTAATYTPVIGLNTLSFTAPFNWDGVSNIVIEVCHGNSGSSATMSSTAKVDNTSFVSTIHTHKSSASAGSLTCADLSTNLTTYSVRPKFVFNVGVDLSSNYTWQWNPGAINSNTTSIVAVNNGTTPIVNTYTVAITNTLTGCSNTKVVSFSVNPIPTLSISATTTSVCLGSSATLSAAGSVTSYSWAPQASTAFGIVVTPTTTTTYTLIGTALGCSNTKTVTITTVALPTVSASSSATSAICAGTSQTLTATGSATNFTWSPSGIQNAVAVTAPTVTTVYSVTGNDGSCSRTTTTSVTVIANPVVNIAASNSNICIGATSNATLTASGTATTYTWLPTNENTAVSVVAPTTSTTYTLLGKNSQCTTTKTIAINVANAPSLTALTLGSANVCAGNTGTLSAAGSATSFTWMPVGGNAPTAVVTPTANETYTVIGEADGCVSQATVSLAVVQIPTVTASASKVTICNGENSVLTASSSATSYTWSSGANTVSTTVTPTTTTVYTVTVSDNGCEAQALITVTVNACTSINEEIASSIELYPNPTNGLLHVVIPENMISQSVIEMYDGLGKLVMREVLSKQDNKVYINKLEEGMYFYKIISDTKEVRIGKVIKF